MKETIRRKLTKNNGITLVALVVTIVVLLILAGVSINLVIGNNGIINKAKEAKEKTKQAQYNTEKEMNVLTDWIDEQLADSEQAGGKTDIAVITGDGTNIGDEIAIGDEHFYVVDVGTDTVSMLAKYNLLVGNQYDGTTATPLPNPTGLQDETALGNVSGSYPYIGVTEFSNDSKHGTEYATYEGSVVEEYVNNYVEYLKEHGAPSNITGNIMTKSAIIGLCSDYPDETWCAPIHSEIECLDTSSYWTKTMEYSETLWVIDLIGDEVYLEYSNGYCSNDKYIGVRPVITISKSDLPVVE